MSSKILTDLALENFNNIIGYRDEYRDLYIECEIPPEDDPFKLTKKSEYTTCQNCDYAVSYICNECEDSYCQYCVSWEILPCGDYSCGNHKITYCGESSGVPHSHATNNNTYCYCKKHFNDDLQVYSKSMMEYCLQNDECPVAGIVLELLDKNSDMIKFFDGGCGCSPHCGCHFRSVLCVKEEHNKAIEWGFDQSYKKYIERYPKYTIW